MLSGLLSCVDDIIFEPACAVEVQSGGLGSHARIINPNPFSWLVREHKT